MAATTVPNPVPTRGTGAGGGGDGDGSGDGDGGPGDLWGYGGYWSNGGHGGSGDGGHGDGEGGGHGGSSGSGGNGGGGGGRDELGPGAASGESPESALEPWQLNPKLNLSLIPEWDGRGTTIIDYVVRIAYLCSLGWKMNIGVVQMVPSKFTGNAMAWWYGVPPLERALYTRNFQSFLGAICQHFLTAEWLEDRTREFEEMRFRQRGHTEEEPREFFQRRVNYHGFIFEDAQDGYKAVLRILCTQPPEWNNRISPITCPGIALLLQEAEHQRSNLIGDWGFVRRIKSLSAATPVPSSSSKPPAFHRRRCANAADRMRRDDESESSTDSEGEGGRARHGHVAENRQSGGQRNNCSERTAPTGPKPPWPRGGTVNGHEFKRDNSVSSVCPPNGECFICTSPKHVTLDCPHRDCWQALRSANLIHVDFDVGDETKEYQEYLVMLAECKAEGTVPAYPSDSKTPEPAKEIILVDARRSDASAAHLVDHGYNRNRHRRDAFTKEKKGKQEEKGKAVERDDPVKAPPLPHRQIRKAARVAELPSMVLESGVRVLQARKARQLPDGLGSLGARALHVKVKVGSLDQEEVRGRMDSGADITLMSEEFWESIPDLPKPREGIRMKLYHLTGQAKVLGYIKAPLFMISKEGEVISFEMEAYVVRNMRVPLLLGEDFQ
ncbi:hypothetical protein C8R44DRAFT_621723, partial [Mycena epipterygia]